MGSRWRGDVFRWPRRFRSERCQGRVEGRVSLAGCLQVPDQPPMALDSDCESGRSGHRMAKETEKSK
jgi:hypothetical protein